MQRISCVLQVRADRLDEYRRRHTPVWPEMLTALKESGWRNYWLFLRDDGLLATDLANGILLCTHNHHMVHRQGWDIRVIDNVPWFIPPASIDSSRTPRRGGRIPTPIAPSTTQHHPAPVLAQRMMSGRQDTGSQSARDRAEAQCRVGSGRVRAAHGRGWELGMAHRTTGKAEARQRDSHLTSLRMQNRSSTLAEWTRLTP
ncbi:MAG: L-rhamnose mutarotase [Burkholderiaceae bacterium]|nr:L-rhamnose mutarotase [Microbacteriaceae bacterium]